MLDIVTMLYFHCTLVSIIPIPLMYWQQCAMIIVARCGVAHN